MSVRTLAKRNKNVCIHCKKHVKSIDISREHIFPRFLFRNRIIALAHHECNQAMGSMIERYYQFFHYLVARIIQNKPYKLSTTKISQLFNRLKKILPDYLFQLVKDEFEALVEASEQNWLIKRYINE